jgi:hypothetical protein
MNCGKVISDFKSHVAGNYGKLRARTSTVQLTEQAGSDVPQRWRVSGACAMNAAAAIRQIQKRGSYGN